MYAYTYIFNWKTISVDVVSNIRWCSVIHKLARRTLTMPWQARNHMPWWRPQMETFSALLALCKMTLSKGNISHVTGHLCREFTGPRSQRPVTRSFDVFFDLRLNKRLSKQWWGWWFETLPRPLWRHSSGSGNSPVTGEFPPQRPVARSCDVFFDLRLNKRLSKQSWGWWLETPSHPLWCHCNARPPRVVKMDKFCILSFSCAWWNCYMYECVFWLRFCVA